MVTIRHKRTTAGSLVNQTTFLVQGIIAYSISTSVERVWRTFKAFFISAAHPHPGVLIDSCGFLNHNSTLIMVCNPVVSHTDAADEAASSSITW